MGATKRPFYRIIVADSRSPRDGRFIESIGYYDPLTNPTTVKVDAEKYQRWVKNGAQPSESVARVISRSGALEAAAKESEPITPNPVQAASAAGTEETVSA
jgi:small subunit ribosomal protein S16